MSQHLDLDPIEAAARNAARIGSGIHPDTITVMAAEIRRLRDRVAELEAYAYGCDAEGCVLPHSSWCDVATKRAAENDGCTCGQPWTGHPQPHAMHCWTVNPPRAEVEEMRRALAASRSETFREAAGIADSLRQFDPAFGARKSAQISENVGILRVVDELRRHAALPAAEEAHVVADDSDDPEHIDDCPGCEDTLPAWLHQRFDPRGPDWEQLSDDDRAYWEHQARAVRRAVARGGFKTDTARP